MSTIDGADPYSDDRGRWDQLESLQAQLLSIRYDRDIGLPFSPEEIDRLGAAVAQLSLEMAPDYKDDREALGLFSRLVQSSKALSLGVVLQAKRDPVLSTTMFREDASPITPYNVHQFLRVEPDAAKRRAVLAHFCQGDPEIDALDEERRLAQWDISRKIGMNPLDEFLDSEQMTAESLKALLLSLGDELGPTARSILLARREEYFPDATGALTWEDYIAVGLRGDSKTLKENGVDLAGFDGLAKAVETAQQMGFSADKIYADLVDRPKKYPGATAYRVRIPADVRIRVKPLGDPVGDSVTLYHEMGHALHFITIDPDLPLPARIGFNFATSETFSFWLQSLWMSREYLERDIGLASGPASALVVSSHKGFLLSAVAISAAALAIVEYWLADHPMSLEEIGRSLSGYLLRFLGISIPSGAIRWYTGNVLALEINTLGYPVALARLGHLLPALESNRSDWWRTRESVAMIRQCMSGGRRAGFPNEFFDTEPFIARVLEFASA